MIKKQSVILAGLAGLFFLVAGCASIINGSAQKVPISSTPDGAKVTVYDGQNNVVHSANTPARLI
ncbi:MAG: hypothetical protein U0586_14695 [Candidatus Brocadiaceae bacterium]